MARRQSVVLIRKLVGNGSNPSPGLLHLLLPKLVPNSIQTLTLTSTVPSPSSSSPLKIEINVPSTSKLLPSYYSLHSLQHRRPLSSAAAASPAAAPAPASAISFSSPSTMFNITTKADYERAIKKVKDGLLPAVFCFTQPHITNYIDEAPIILKLREKFPHVTIYKILMVKCSIAKIGKVINNQSIFHLYQNGKKVDEIDGSDVCLINKCRKLYRYVIPVETTQPTSPSGMGKKRYQQLVIQTKKDENGEGVKGGPEPGGTGTLLQQRSGATTSQWRGAATLSQQSRTTEPSLDEVMWEVETVGLGYYNGALWWFAKGLFKSQPEKRVVFLKKRPSSRWAWLVDQMAQE